MTPVIFIGGDRHYTKNIGDGTRRAADRIAAAREIWARTPVIAAPISRQRRRWIERRAEKSRRKAEARRK